MWEEYRKTREEQPARHFVSRIDSFLDAFNELRDGLGTLGNVETILLRHLFQNLNEISSGSMKHYAESVHH
jgi:hypothetical protein